MPANVGTASRRPTFCSVTNAAANSFCSLLRFSKIRYSAKTNLAVTSSDVCEVKPVDDSYFPWQPACIFSW